jgi:hypothetical protein
MAVTWKPSSSNLLHRWLPRKPAPPVTVARLCVEDPFLADAFILKFLVRRFHEPLTCVRQQDACRESPSRPQFHHHHGRASLRKVSQAGTYIPAVKSACVRARRSGNSGGTESA